MNANELIRYIREQNGLLWLEGECLRYDIPRGILSESEKVSLREMKQEIIELLNSTEPRKNQGRSFAPHLVHCETATPEEGVFGCGGFLFIQSWVLSGETVVFAEDTLELPLDKRGLYKGHVVYRERELRHMAKDRPSKQTLQMVHVIKKEIGGEYVGEQAILEVESGITRSV